MNLILFFLLLSLDIYENRGDITAIRQQEVVDLRSHCMGIQCITAGRLNRYRHVEPQMEALRELEEFVEKLDLTQQEEHDVARIMERLREEKR